MQTVTKQGQMAKRTKKMDLEKIPEIQGKVVSLINREVEVLADKDNLTAEEAKNLIAFSTLLSTLYKDYRAEVIAIKKDLKELPKEDLQKIIKAEAN
jgi:hypothetical protein